MRGVCFVSVHDILIYLKGSVSVDFCGMHALFPCMIYSKGSVSVVSRAVGIVNVKVVFEVLSIWIFGVIFEVSIA